MLFEAIFTERLCVAGGYPRDEFVARNPHDLIRSIEVLNILTSAEIVLHSCLARKASSRELHFTRLDYPDNDPPAWHKFVTVQRTADGVRYDAKPLDYYGNLPENYERENRDYIARRSAS